ncbi:MAG: VacJ family lipoprotein [Pseudolabrys sp.]
MRCGQVLIRWAVACVLPILVGGCAATPRDASLPINDPNEETNRQVLAMNQAVLSPVADVIKTVTPRPVHDRLRDFNSNLKEPRIFVNNILQLRFDAALHTAGRFAMNSTFGLGGLVDLASREGLPQESGDFGQTLFVWGVPEGSYVMRPYLGPSTFRDAVGSTVDLFGDPLGMLMGTQVGVAIATATLDATVRLGDLKSAEDASIDFYSFLRSGYYQTRRAQLRESIGLPSDIESPATSLAEAENSAPSNNASVSSPIPRSGVQDNALRPNTKQAGRADQEPTRALALTTR